jgi:hypothetical protein
MSDQEGDGNPAPYRRQDFQFSPKVVRVVWDFQGFLGRCAAAAVPLSDGPLQGIAR